MHSNGVRLTRVTRRLRGNVSKHLYRLPSTLFVPLLSPLPTLMNERISFRPADLYDRSTLGSTPANWVAALDLSLLPVPSHTVHGEGACFGIGGGRGQAERSPSRQPSHLLSILPHVYALFFR